MSAEEASVQYRYGSLRILRDGQVRFSARTLPGLPELDFSAHYGVGAPGGVHVWDRANYRISARWPGASSFFMLYLARHRVVSACFNYGLTPDEMRRAVALLRKARGGLDRWIVPGLEYTRDSLAQIQANPGFRNADDGRGAAMQQVIQELLEACRDLPVAEPWKRQRRAKTGAGTGAPVTGYSGSIFKLSK